MSALKSIGMRLVAVSSLLLAPFAVHAALYLDGPSDWYRGEIITFEVRADADTVLNTYTFVSDYSAFADILEIKNNPTTTLPPAIAPPPPTGALCNSFDSGDACLFSSAFPPMILGGTVLTQWVFQVKKDAPTGEVNSFDLGVFAATGTDISDEAVPWMPANKAPFQVVAIPESSSWVLMIAGLAAVGTRAYRRRIA